LVAANDPYEIPSSAFLCSRRDNPTIRVLPQISTGVESHAMSKSILLSTHVAVEFFVFEKL